MYELPLPFVTYYEKQLEIAKRFVAMRKKKKVTQKRMVVLSGVPYATIRRFEKTGDISFASFVKLAMALQCYDDLDNLFQPRTKYRSIEEALCDQ